MRNIHVHEDTFHIETTALKTVHSHVILQVYATSIYTRDIQHVAFQILLEWSTG